MSLVCCTSIVHEEKERPTKHCCLPLKSDILERVENTWRVGTVSRKMVLQPEPFLYGSLKNYALKELYDLNGVRNNPFQ